MESNQSLFSLNIDPVTKVHLSEMAKWARFLAIIGIISLVLMVVLIIGFLILMGGGDAENPYTNGMAFPCFGAAGEKGSKRSFQYWL